MGINAYAIGILVLAIGAHMVYAYYKSKKEDNNPHFLPFTPIQVGKARSFVNQTSDAGMYTEYTRRKAIIQNEYPVFGYKGFTNGAVEWHFLTSICVCSTQRLCPQHGVSAIYDAGGAAAEVCDIIDGDGVDVLDLGGADATGNVCNG